MAKYPEVLLDVPLRVPKIATLADMSVSPDWALEMYPLTEALCWADPDRGSNKTEKTSAARYFTS